MSKKRANNEGTIRKRSDGLWEARFHINNERKSVYGKTQAEVARKQRDALSSADQGQYIEPSKLTVGTWLTQWEEIYGRPTWRDTTASTHHDSIKNHLIPAFGKFLLQNLSAEHIQRFIIARQKNGAKPATIVKELSPLKSAMRQAVLLKKRIDNPFTAVKQPKIVQDEISYLTKDEQVSYIAALPNTTIARLLRFILGTGLRIGEAIALRWSDVQKDSFTVRQTIATVSNLESLDNEPRTKQSIHRAKTKAGMRTIPLSKAMRNLLDQHKLLQAEEFLRFGIVSKDVEYVFASAANTSLLVRNVRRVHNRTLEKANVKRITLHGLRHSFATRWVSLDNDIRGLSEILGHADVATTLRRYVHSDPTHKVEMMEKMASYELSQAL